MHNVQPYESGITHAKSSKLPRMFQCDAVDTSPDLGGNMPPKTVEMADITDPQARNEMEEGVFVKKWTFPTK